MIFYTLFSSSDWGSGMGVWLCGAHGLVAKICKQWSSLEGGGGGGGGQLGTHLPYVMQSSWLIYSLW